jgi:hypothetical protein
MSKHTPGPWSWHGDELLSDKHFVLACTRHTRPSRDDARLLAAAPELLSELESILEWAIIEKAPLRPQEIAHIRAVIAKATGADDA